MKILYLIAFDLIALVIIVKLIFKGYKIFFKALAIYFSSLDDDIETFRK